MLILAVLGFLGTVGKFCSKSVESAGMELFGRDDGYLEMEYRGTLGGLTSLKN